MSSRCAATVRVITDRYRARGRALGKDPKDMPLMGVARHVVVADTDDEALAIARRAYPRWATSFRWLWERHGVEPRITALYPPTFDELVAIGNGIAGSPRTVRDFLAAEIAASGANYLSVVVRVRRHDARRIAAFCRAVRARGDARLR